MDETVQSETEESEAVTEEVVEPDPEPPILEAETVVEEPEVEPEIMAEPEPVDTVKEPEEPVQATLDAEPESEAESEPQPTPVDETEAKTGEEVVTRARKKRRRKGATDPLSHIRSSGRKKERGKAGA